jgi:hypothetical protein
MELTTLPICDDVWNRDLRRRRKWQLMNLTRKLKLLKKLQLKESQRMWSTVRLCGLRDFCEIEKICRNFFDCCCKACNCCDLLRKK